LPTNAIARLIETGKALILLDGLDEITSPPEDGIDSRQLQSELLLSLPSSTPIVVSCRHEDYQQLKTIAPLNGAVTLQPLKKTQVDEYLSDLPELLSAVQASSDLQMLISTPLLLNLLATSCRDLEPAARTELTTLSSKPTDLRDFLIERYVHTRYEWEERRAARQRAVLPFSLQQTMDSLCRLAMENVGTYRKKRLREGWHRGSYVRTNILAPEDFQLLHEDEHSVAYAFRDFAILLDVLVDRGEGVISFRHLLVRDGLASPYSLRNLRTLPLYGMVVEVSNPADTLARCNKTRATEHLLDLLSDKSQPEIVRECAAAALGHTEDPRSVGALIENLNHNRFSFRSAIALGFLGNMRAYDPLIHTLENGGKYGSRGAAIGLGFLGDPRAAPNLARRLDELEDWDDAFTMEEIARVILPPKNVSHSELL
jgi:hypothetical protein